MRVEIIRSKRFAAAVSFSLATLVGAGCNAKVESKIKGDGSTAPTAGTVRSISASSEGSGGVRAQATLTNNELRFSQVANGLLGNDTFVSTLLVSNPHSSAVEVQVASFDHDNPSRSMGLNLSSSCPLIGGRVIVPGWGACKLESNGQGLLHTGWMLAWEVHGRTIGGSLVYTFISGPSPYGTPIWVAGVGHSTIMDQFSIPISRDYYSGDNMGIAVANRDDRNWKYMKAQLININGRVLAERQIRLAPYGHTALFATEIFPDELSYARDFVGNMLVTGYSGSDRVIATALLTRGDKFGAFPPTANSYQVYSRSADESFSVPPAANFETVKEATAR